MVLAIAALGLAYGANPTEVIRSAAPFEGAIDGISMTTIISYLPGYGLNVNALHIGTFDVETIHEQLLGIVTGLSGLVRGLDTGDVVSVAWTGQPWSGDDVHIVVRMVPGDVSSLEVFIDGQPVN